jgi:hypothetical protein
VVVSSPSRAQPAAVNARRTANAAFDLNTGINPQVKGRPGPCKAAGIIGTAFRGGKRSLR